MTLNLEGCSDLRWSGLEAFAKYCTNLVSLAYSCITHQPEVKPGMYWLPWSLEIHSPLTHPVNYFTALDALVVGSTKLQRLSLGIEHQTFFEKHQAIAANRDLQSLSCQSTRGFSSISFDSTNRTYLISQQFNCSIIHSPYIFLYSTFRTIQH